jgi:hypothetical protein
MKQTSLRIEGNREGRWGPCSSDLTMSHWASRLLRVEELQVALASFFFLKDLQVEGRIPTFNKD